MRTFFQDLRYAMRQLRKAPGFTLAAVLTLALGIGVNAAMFTLTYAILLKSLPVPEPGRLIRYTFQKGDMDIGLSGPAYDAIRRRQTAATDVLAWGLASFVVRENGVSQDVRGALMSGNGFAVLGVKPFLGRVFGEAEDVNGGGANGYQALLGYDYWMVHFHADKDVVGRTLNVNGSAVTIIGILPKGFAGVMVGERADIVLPLAFTAVVHPQKEPYRNTGGNFWLTVMGRLRPGESVKSARANLQAIQPQVYAEADPNKTFLQGFFKSFVLGVEGGSAGRSYLRTTYSQPLLLLELLSGLLLLLCCTNIGLLMLARASERRHEFALRSALGASDARQIGMVLLEVLLFALPGLAAGMAIGSALARALAAMLGSIGAPSSLDASPNLAVFLFSCGIAIVTAFAAALWPALRVRRIAPAFDLKQSGNSASGRTTGAWIIPVQVAVSVTLLVSALLLGSTFARLYLEPSGFAGKELVFADVNLRSEKLNASESAQAAETVLASLKNAPGIDSAALMSMFPLRGFTTSTGEFSIDRHGNEHADPEVWPEAVSPGYFETIGTKILAGRALTAADATGEKACVLSRSAADFFFPGEEAIGHFVYSDDDDSGKAVHTANPKNARRVVGIAEDAHFFSLRKQADHVIYTPITKEEYLGFGGLSPLVRARSVELAAADIRNVFKRVAPASPPPIVYTYSDLVRDQLRKERMLISLSSSFAGIALLLVAVGLFGILMRSITQRTREIGIRIALGEQRASIVKTILASALKRVGLGVVIGSALAYASSRLMRALLYETSLGSPWVYVVAGVLLFAVTICAAAWPSHRAASIEPMDALRAE